MDSNTIEQPGDALTPTAHAIARIKADQIRRFSQLHPAAFAGLDSTAASEHDWALQFKHKPIALAKVLARSEAEYMKMLLELENGLKGLIELHTPDQLSEGGGSVNNVERLEDGAEAARSPFTLIGMRFLLDTLRHSLSHLILLHRTQPDRWQQVDRRILYVRVRVHAFASEFALVMGREGRRCEGAECMLDVACGVWSRGGRVKILDEVEVVRIGWKLFDLAPGCSGCRLLI